MPTNRNRTNKQLDWIKVDLHLHTPASKDYHEPDKSYLDILKKAESEGLDMIAFTDHNTVAGYGRMMQEVSDLERWESTGRLQPAEKERLAEYRRLLAKIIVLPGVEITATFGFHILGIFDPDTPIRSLEHALLSLNIPFESLDEGETEVGATSDVLTAYRILDEAGALVIAAHANSTHGVAMFGLDFGGQTRIAYTQDPHLHALEVTDLETRRRRSTARFFSGSKPQYPRRMHCIQGSDAHRIAAKGRNLGVGERATEILVAEPTFAEIKAVLTGDDFARTRPDRRAAAPFDHVSAARNEGATIVQSFHESMTKRGGRMHAVLRDVVAFSNTNGGTIYVGVSPNQKVAIKGIEQAEQGVREVRNEIDRLVSPHVTPQIDVVKSAGKDIVRITVNKGNDQPYVLEGSKIYVRQESETSMAMRDEIVAIVKRSLQGGQSQGSRRQSSQRQQPSQRQPQQQSQSQQPGQRQQQQQQQSQRQRSQEQSSQHRSSSQRSRQSSAASQPQPKQQPKQAPQPKQQPKQEQPTRSPSRSRRSRSSSRSLQTTSKTQQAQQKPVEQTATPAPEPVAQPSHDIETDGLAPRTGVEIVESSARKGTVFHTMRDLRDGSEVRNVSRESARRLWRYAIALKEKGTFQEDKVNWQGDLGLWHKYLRSGRPHYDLVQKGTDRGMRIYYGVTEDGIHGPWRALVGLDEE